MWEVITPPSHQCSNNEWTAEVQCAILAGCFFFRFYFQVFRISLWPTIGSPPTHVFLCSIDILVFLSEHCDRWPVWSPTFPIQVSENGKSYPISIPIIVTLISQTSARELDHCCGCQGHGAGDAREHLVRGIWLPRLRSISTRSVDASCATVHNVLHLGLRGQPSQVFINI